MADISDEITSTLTGYCINTPSQSHSSHCPFNWLIADVDGWGVVGPESVADC